MDWVIRILLITAVYNDNDVSILDKVLFKKRLQELHINNAKP